MKLRETRIWKAMFRHGLPRDRQGRLGVLIQNFFLHIRARQVREYALKIRHTWCMGGITAFLFGVECLTGIILMFQYRPVPEFAWVDILALREQVPFGIVREIHRWAGHLMVVTIFFHMLRVFLTGAYKPPREFNWVVGVMLLVLTLFLSFTGYLLPWDQLSMWAVTVGSHIAAAPPLAGAEGPVHLFLFGGSEISAATLFRFYVLHCIAAPVVLLILAGVHFWRIRKDGGLAGPL